MSSGFYEISQFHIAIWTRQIVDESSRKNMKEFFFAVYTIELKDCGVIQKVLKNFHLQSPQLFSDPAIPHLMTRGSG